MILLLLITLQTLLILEITSQDIKKSAVIEMNEDFFDEEILNHQYLLVEFYAPWW